MENQDYAGFWVRLGASFIDLIIFSIVLLVPLTFIYGEQYWLSDQLVYGVWDVLLGYIAPFIATVWCWLRFLATPGKMASNLKVVDAKTGSKLTFAQAVIRYLGYIVAAIPAGLGLLLIGVDKKKQGLHDKLAGTVVIKMNEKEAVHFEG